MALTKILVLGSGMVARPCVEYLVRNPKNNVTIGKVPALESCMLIPTKRSSKILQNFV